jgi:hypothetical protein
LDEVVRVGVIVALVPVRVLEAEVALSYLPETETEPEVPEKVAETVSLSPVKVAAKRSPVNSGALAVADLMPVAAVIAVPRVGRVPAEKVPSVKEPALKPVEVNALAVEAVPITKVSSLTVAVTPEVAKALLASVTDGAVQEAAV